MTEFQSYNVIDKDYKHKIDIEQVSQNEFRVVSLEEGKEHVTINPLCVDTKIANQESKFIKNNSKNEAKKIPKKKKSWSLIANINMF